MKAGPTGSDPLQRAVLYSTLPGVTRAQACERFGVSRRALADARKRAGRPDRHELVLASLTRCGALTSGEPVNLGGIARFVDWQNHDGTRPEDVVQLLDDLVDRGVIQLDGDRWELRIEWP